MAGTDEQTGGACLGDFPDDTPADDYRLCFMRPDLLEILGSGSFGNDAEYVSRTEYGHLKEAGIDLESAKLTDRQMIAVSLVFYGGVTRTRAALAMGISTQSLAEHISNALKKIEKSLY